MRQMMTLVFFIVIVLGTYGCNNPVTCKLEETLINVTSKTIYKNLNCEGVDVIKEDMTKVVKTLKLCEGEQGIGSQICTVVSGLVVEGAVKYGIPSKWKCDPTVTKDKLKEALKEACSLIP